MRLASPIIMTETDPTILAERIVLAFLKKRNYKETEQQLRKEIGAHPDDFFIDQTIKPWSKHDIANFVLLYDKNETNNQPFAVNAFKKLRKWVDGVLETYKVYHRLVFMT